MPAKGRRSTLCEKNGSPEMTAFWEQKKFFFYGTNLARVIDRGLFQRQNQGSRQMIVWIVIIHIPL
jgi:hypothetical protein